MLGWYDLRAYRKIFILSIDTFPIVNLKISSVMHISIYPFQKDRALHADLKNEVKIEAWVKPGTVIQNQWFFNAIQR